MIKLIISLITALMIAMGIIDSDAGMIIFAVMIMTVTGIIDLMHDVAVVKAHIKSIMEGK